MAGYSPASFPVSYYEGFFVDEIQKNLKLYWQCNRLAIPVSGKTLDLYSKGSEVGAVPIQEIANWENFSSVNPVQTRTNPEVEKLVKLFGAEVASSVEFLIRQEAAKYGNQKDVRNLVAADIFHRADGSPNLNLMIVNNAPCSVSDPCALIPGWVAYKFHFAVGFPAKGK